ncbi:MAG: thioredoxin domain-containing protein [Anaerolineales bacterium]
MYLSEFQTKLSTSEKPILIDFWATWCVPCVMTKPILEKLAKEYAEQVDFVPINADDSQDILKHLGIFGIPTVIAFRGNEEVGRVTGAKNENTYRMIFENLSGGNDIKIPISQLDRILRLGLGAGFIILGISASNWPMVGLGSVISFLGIYDHCPMWNLFTGNI